MVASPTWTTVTDTWDNQTAFWNGWYTIILEPDIIVDISYELSLSTIFLLWFRESAVVTADWIPEDQL